MIARVLPDLPAVDRPFDYLVPDAVRDQVRVGSLVRIELHGRRVGGWVVDLAPDDASEVAPERLKSLAKLSSDGPPPEVVSLAAWAAWRWAGRWVHLLRAASPPTNVHTPVPPAAPEGVGAPGVGAGGVVVRRMAPSADRLPLVLAAAADGPALVVVPAVELAVRLADRLRREGHRTALLAGDVRAADYVLAASGQATVVGTRVAAWAPIPDAALHSVLVLDEHDEALQSERAPTWHAREVAVERARRAGVPCTLVSPVPTLAALALAGSGAEPVVDPGERGGWPIVEVVDRRDEEPGRGSLFTPRLVDLLREGPPAVCILNRTGRSRLLACTACGTIADCERCGAAVSQPGDGDLVCGHCATTRPVVCAACGSGRFKNLRMGVSRAREELEALVGEPVAEVTGTSADELPRARVTIGTEALLHRLPGSSVGVVAFLDLDQELLAPRYRAAEQTMSLLARAARVAGPRRGGGRLLLQTRHADHPVVRALGFGDPGRLTEPESERRRALRLPPFGAVAVVSGAGATEWAAGAPEVEGIDVLDGPDATWMVRAPDPSTLADYLDLVERPPERTRIEVDPPRL